MLKKSDIPDVLSYRLNGEDRETVWQLIQKRKPRKLATLVRDALENLLKEELSQ